METRIIVTLVVIAILSTLSQLIAWRIRVPSIFFLLVTGIIIGPVTGFFNLDQFFGPLLFPLISLAVAVILFEGSLTLKFAEIRGQHRYILRFIFVGAQLLGWALV